MKGRLNQVLPRKGVKTHKNGRTGRAFFGNFSCLFVAPSLVHRFAAIRPLIEKEKAAYSKNRATPVELSRPPRSLARSISVFTAAWGVVESRITLVISSTDTKRVMPSLQIR